MPIYEYKCEKCKLDYEKCKPMAESDTSEYCKVCGCELSRVFNTPGITGGRDGFGIGKGWVTDKGVEVDNWKTWEKEGYRDPLNSPNIKAKVKEGIKRKVEKIKKYDNKKRFSVTMGGK